MKGEIAIMNIKIKLFLDYWGSDTQDLLNYKTNYIEKLKQC